MGLKDTYIGYDTFINRLFINLYSLGKENNNSIEIDNFNKKDSKYKIVYEICNLLKIYYNYSIFINMPWYHKLFNKYRKTKGKNNMEKPINIDELISFTSEGLDLSLDELYDTYYNTRKD